MDLINLKDGINYFDGYSTRYRIIIEEYEKGVYAKFKVYEVSEDDIDNFIDLGIEEVFAEFAFSCWLSYKHIFPYYGEEKKSSSKYHTQLSDLESMKIWHDTIHDVCEIVMKKYEIHNL